MRYAESMLELAINVSHGCLFYTRSFGTVSPMEYGELVKELTSNVLHECSV